MIILNFVHYNQTVGESEKENTTISTLIQRNDHVEIERGVYQFFFKYGTAMIQAIDETITKYLQSTYQDVIKSVEDIAKFDNHYENAFVSDYVTLFQTIKNIANGKIDKKNNVVENIKIVDVVKTNTKHEAEKAIIEYQNRGKVENFNVKAEIVFKDGKYNAIIERIYKNVNVSMHIENMKGLYAEIVNRAMQIHELNEAKKRMYENLEALQNVDIVKLIETVNELKQRVAQLEEALVNQAIQQAIDHAKEQDEKQLQAIENDIIESTKEAYAKIFDEEPEIKDVEDAKVKLTYTRSIISFIREKANEVKNAVLQKGREVVNRIKNVFKRDKKRDRGLER